jgi:hypothetical protein
MHISFTFVHEPSGRDVTGTEDVAGYVAADYFSSDIAETLRLANNDTDTAEAWLRSAYLGPDSDGIGVHWTLTPDGEG